MFQAAYSPLWKLENVPVYRTALLAASRMEIVSLRAVEPLETCKARLSEVEAAQVSVVASPVRLTVA
jgi:hypothetical protein